MKDYGKAAVRCLKFFIESETIALKKSFLNKAEEHFNKALHSVNISYLRSSYSETRENINNAIKMIKLQNEILNLFPKMNKNLHVFGNKYLKVQICREILLENPEFVLKVKNLYF